MNLKTNPLRILIVLYCISLSSILNSQITIGDCTNGGAAVSGGYSDANDANSNWSSGLETFSPSASNEQVTTHHAVNSGTTGAIGFVVSTGSQNLTNQACIDDNNRSAVLYAVGDCNGTPITPSTDTPGSNYSNYEFTGLNPNTDYILVVTIDPVSDCDVQDLAVTYYSITPSGCNADIGDYDITDATQVGAYEYDLDDGCSINLDLNNLVIPSGGEVRWAVFSQIPTLPLTNAQLNDLTSVTGFLGTDGNQATSVANTGGQSVTPAGFTTLWAVPFTTDNTGTSTQIDDGDDCYDIQSNAIQINFTSTPCTPPVNTCGDCSTADCPVNQVSTFANRSYLSGCNTVNPDISNQTYITYHTVSTDINGAIGLVQGTDINPNPCNGLSRTAVLRPATNTCSEADISPSVSNANGVGSGFNPEWYGLTPSTNYVAIVTTVIPATCNYGEGCLNAYGIPNPPDPCAMQNGSVQTCNCEFTDSGGNSGNYGASENNTFTICPDPAQTGAKIQLDFTNFVSEDGYDFMYIYDGNTATGQPIISVSGSNPTELNSTIAATVSNASGCLTVVFTSDFAGQEAGWTADVTCYTPCTNPIADASTVEFGTQQTIRICPGDQLNFDASTSTHNASSITNYAWEFDNGTPGSSVTETVTFNDPGRYIPFLTVTNDEGCSSTNALPYEIIVSTVPNFNGTTADQTACEGDQVCLTGVINYPTLVDPPEVPPTGTVSLPDGTGVAYETTVRIKGYANGQTITSANDIQSICVNMEHSAADDITITLISPTGQTLVLHNRGGETMVLGNPILDANAYLASQGCSWPTTPTGPGTGLEYCFTPNASTTVANTADGDPNSCDQLPAGDYQSIDPFSNLIGSDINGIWTIRYEDASGNDDGYLFGWNLTFDPSLLPANATISPVISSQVWSGPSTIDSNVDDVICITPDNTGTNTYTYTVTNDFGCIADTTIDVDVTISEDASFSLSATCDGATANITGTTGGSFTFTTPPSDAAVIDANTGTITGGTSGNSYDVTYTTLGSCPDNSNQITTATNSDDASFTLTATCDGATVNITGTTGGSFTFTTPPSDAAVIDANTGTVTGGTSGNTYDITYATTGVCAASSNQTATATNSDDPTFTLTPTCDGATANLTGTTGGTFTFSSPPSDAAVIDANTGTVTGGTSGNTYDITYATTGVCAASSNQTATATNSDDASFTLTATCDGATANITGTTGGSFTFTTPPSDAAVIDANTGTVSGGTSGSTYDITYATSGACAASSNQTVTINTTETPTIGCGTTTLTSVEFTITNTLTGVTDYNVSYTINGGNTSIDNNVSFPYIVSSLTGGDLVAITVTPNGTGCYLDGSGSCTANSCNPPNITSHPANSIECEGQSTSFNVVENGGNGIYSWEVSNDGTNFTTLTDGGVYSGTTTSTLNISDNTGLNSLTYRVVVYETLGSCPTISNNATLTSLSITSADITCGIAGEDSVEFNWTIPNGATDFDLTYSIMGQSNISVSNHPTNRFGVTGLNIGDTVSITVNPNGAGCYTTSSNICFTSCTPPNASFLPSPSKMTTLNTTTTMINSSSNATSYFWDFGDGQTSIEEAPTNQYSDLDTGTYLITLTASNGSCQDIATYYVKIFEDLVYYIPNTFTPYDGNDYNQLFKPVFTSGYDTGNYSMEIFNRWGELVFSTTDINQGWDGKDMRNSKICEDGTYVWKIGFGVKSIDKKEWISGHVNLLR